jgi:hypothetical protein
MRQDKAGSFSLFVFSVDFKFVIIVKINIDDVNFWNVSSTFCATHAVGLVCLWLYPYSGLIQYLEHYELSVMLDWYLQVVSCVSGIISYLKYNKYCVYYKDQS